MTDIWLEALQKGLRFEFKGLISTEDLFDLDMSSLDVIYQKLSKELREISGDSLLDNEKADEIAWVQLKLDVVKHVFDIKKAEAEALRQKIANIEEKQRIMHIINEKENAELANLSIDELKEKLNDLE